MVPIYGGRDLIPIIFAMKFRDFRGMGKETNIENCGKKNAPTFSMLVVTCCPVLHTRESIFSLIFYF